MNEILEKRVNLLKSMENIILGTLSDEKAFGDWSKFIRNNVTHGKDHFIQLAENEELYLKTCETFKKILDKYSKTGFVAIGSKNKSLKFTIKTSSGNYIFVEGFEELAETICEHGKTEDLIGYNEAGEELFDTFGIYLNKVSDLNFRENLLNYLMPMQKNIFIKDSLNSLNQRLKSIYSADTSFDAQNWNPDNPTYGHCAVVSLIVKDNFDNAEICKIKVDGVSHYFNRINNQVIDFTKEQFNQKLDYSNFEISSREYLLSNENTKTRYELLKERM